MNKQTCPSLLFFLIVFIFSCSVRLPVPGNYYSKGSTYISGLKLNTNGSFILQLDNFERKADYLGKWKYISRDTLLLTYDVEDFPRIVKSEHEFKKEQKIVLLNHNELKYGNFVLSKLKQSGPVASVGNK